MADVSEAELDAGAWSTFRSEPMAAIRICLPTDDTVALSTVRALAGLNIVMIVDNNAGMPLIQRRYKQEVVSCLECLRLLRALEQEVIDADEEEKGRFDRNDEDVGMGFIYTDLEQPLEKLLGWSGEVSQFNGALADITSHRNHQVELKEVLLRSGDFLAHADEVPRAPEPSRSDGVEMADMSTGLLSDQDRDVESQRKDDGLRTLSGVVRTENVENFAKHIFRALRGLVITQFKHIEERITDPETNTVVFKSAFTAFFHGEESLKSVTRIAKAYNCNIYDIPGSAGEREALVRECEEQVTSIDSVVEQTKRGKLQVLRAFYQQVVPIKGFVKQEMVVYHTLNRFVQSPSGTLLTANCWTPAYACDQIQAALEEGNRAGNATPGYLELLSERNPTENDVIMKNAPTFIRTNRFTGPFQGIVNTYGIPRYREINPGFFAIGMFPFLFGVMFGDIVHGAMLLMFALYLVIMEDRYANHELGEIFQMVYGARYLLLVMGLCAFYMGFIYNESLSIAVNLFEDSAYHSGEHFPARPYIFGVDSVWRHSSNMIQYTNSLKMKMSIVIGVLQMYFGIGLKLLNNIFFNRYMECMVESVPELLFMGLTFGYMSVLIFLKWSIDYPNHPDCFTAGCEGVLVGDGYPLTAAPPSIIKTMIGMFKMEPMQPQDALFPGQESFQTFILTIAVASLPVLLLGKPFYIKRQMDAEAEEREGSEYRAVDDDASGGKHGSGRGDEDEEEHNFGDVVVHQGIHTVEFALGCVSNTASYLRLWALSLAHSQLSEVFWEYILMGYNFALFGNHPGIAGGGFTLIPCVFVFFCCTIGILMCMESLSAFLHALRLQWVEFQSKFYAADGVMFVPLSFEMEVEEA